MNTNVNQMQLKITDMLDTNFGDVVTLPDFITPVPGSYIVTVHGAEVKDADQEKPYVMIMFHMVTAVEPDEAVAMNYPEGSPFSLRYYGGGGVSRIKKVFGQVIETLGVGSLSELLDRLPGLELGVVITNRKDRDDATKIYADIKTAVLS